MVSGATDEVVEAVIVSGTTEQRLHRLPGGYFVGIPGLEGGVEIRCSDGSKDQQGYVTGAMSTRVRVVSTRPCRLVEL